MTVEVPFLNLASERQILKRYHQTANTVRVSLAHLPSLRKGLSDFPRLWLDPAVDGFDHLLSGRAVDDRWRKLMERRSEWAVLSDKVSVKKPDRQSLKHFAYSVLDECLPLDPRWLTVPQLPVTSDASRNRANRLLAEMAYDWAQERDFSGELVLPLVFTHRDQIKGRTQWRGKLRVAKQCLQSAHANIVWAVDSSLSDDQGSSNLGKRLPALVGFHEDLRETFPEERVIAGPYWGMNLVLWVRKLCDQPAVSLGSGYRYFVTGGTLRPGKSRMAIPAIRRRAVAEGALRGWLDRAVKRLSPADPARPTLVEARNNVNRFSSSKGAARHQVASFYGQWFSDLEALPPSGRALSLFQDFSSAFVVGRQLPQLPRSDTPRDPAKVAQQLMVNCL